MAAAMGGTDEEDQRPRPDPTKLTVDLLNHEIAALKEIVFTRFEGMDRALGLANVAIQKQPQEFDKVVGHLKDLLETRLGAMDRAIALLQSIHDRMPLMIDEKIESLRGVHEEKFLSIQTQFRERDVRTEQSSKDSKVAVDAALQAAKEAVGEQNKSSALAIAKSEASTVKQIDQMGLLITTQAKGVDDKFSDVKDRLTRMEGQDVGKLASDTSRQSMDTFRQGNNSNSIAIIAAIIAVIAIVALYVKH